jgi:hypothetical protein
LITVAAALPSVRAAAQWLNYPTPGTPRTADGQPDLSGPIPRTVDGKPDLSGLWGMNGGVYSLNIAADLGPQDIKPRAAALFREHAVNLQKDDPYLRCLPQGPRINLFTPLLEKIIQTPLLIGILMEDLTFRQIFLDGRQLPKDPNPTFMGYSVGHWKGDTLEVDSAGFNDRTWLDLGGHTHSEALHIRERFHRRDFGHMDIEETLDDPESFQKSFTVTIRAELVPDTDLLEYVCAENEKDRQHLVGKLGDADTLRANVAPDVLAKYVGAYEFSFEGSTIRIAFNVRMSGGELFFDIEGKGKFPLIPLSETAFSAAGERIEFFEDERGVVTHFVRIATEGDLKYVRRPDPQ